MSTVKSTVIESARIEFALVNPVDKPDAYELWFMVVVPTEFGVANYPCGTNYSEALAHIRNWVGTYNISLNSVSL